MLNLIPKRIVSKTLLFGKRPIQRIRVGKNGKLRGVPLAKGCKIALLPPLLCKDKNVLELSLSDVNAIYDDVDENTHLHNKDYNPLKYHRYVKYKIAALNLIEAHKNEENKKTALTNITWYSKIRDYFFIHFCKNQMELKEKVVPKFFYPMEK